MKSLKFSTAESLAMCSPLVIHLAQPKAKFCSFHWHGSCRISGCASVAVTSNSGWTLESVLAPGCAENEKPAKEYPYCMTQDVHAAHNMVISPPSFSNTTVFVWISTSFGYIPLPSEVSFERVQSSWLQCALVSKRVSLCWSVVRDSERWVWTITS